MKQRCFAIMSIALTLIIIFTFATTSTGSTIDWGQYATIQSETDGNGLFTYTITAGADPVTFYSGGLHGLTLQFFGLLEVFDPPDFESSITPEGFINWDYTGSSPLTLDSTPIVFSAQSSITDAHLWEFNPGPPYTTYGSLVGEIESDPYGIDTFSSFSFVAPVPEPSTFALFLVGITSVGLVLRRKKQKNNLLSD